MSEKINRETAEQEVESWFNKKKIFQETRDKYKDHADVIVEAVMNCVLVLNKETFEFEHNLLFPLGEAGGKDSIETLKYRARITDKQVAPHMRNVKADDADGRLNALIAAVTNESKAVISSLDSVDKRISTAIGIFFM